MLRTRKSPSTNRLSGRALCKPRATPTNDSKTSSSTHLTSRSAPPQAPACALATWKPITSLTLSTATASVSVAGTAANTTAMASISKADGDHRTHSSIIGHWEVQWCTRATGSDVCLPALSVVCMVDFDQKVAGRCTVNPVSQDDLAYSQRCSTSTLRTNDGLRVQF
jgi:hypothetical protein